MDKVRRVLFHKLSASIDRFPVNAIIGARQVGKSTLAKEITKEFPDSIYLNLERPSHRAKLASPEDYFDQHEGKLICIDEVHVSPDLFSVIRSVVDRSDTKFLILGSASPLIWKQSLESLAGRINYHHLPPFNFEEVHEVSTLRDYHFRGGYPKALLASTDEFAQEWTENYIRTFLERDIRQFGFNIPATSLRRLWTMLAHLNGQQLIYSQLSKALGVSAPTVRSHIDILSNTFLIRILPPFHANIKKRLVKHPKIYLRDTGILHTLLGIPSYEYLYSHPAFGNSWELLVIENIIQAFPKWDAHYYRTAAGSEIDLIVSKGDRRIAFEVKTSSNPKVTRGFWTALEDLEITHAYVLANVRESFPLKKGVQVIGLQDLPALAKDIR